MSLSRDRAGEGRRGGVGGAVSCAPLALRGKRIHFVGIGGCGMSGLARIARGLGARCSGSDQAASAVTQSLVNEGVEVSLEQSAGSLPASLRAAGAGSGAGDAPGDFGPGPGGDWVVISAAIGADHPEVVEARRRGLVVMKYAELLGRLMIGRTGVAIAGTHGKSSTTSMLSHVLIQAGLDPSLIVGANCAQIGGGSRVGGGQGRGAGAGAGDILVAEACEYDRSFHHFHPTLAAILNVEADHMDVYASLDEIVEAFAVFARKLPAREQGGYLLVNHEMAARLTVTAGLDCAVETIGFAYQADWRVGMKDGQARLHHRGEAVMDWKVALPGEHMAYNAGVAAVLAHRLGATWTQIAAALEGFAGLDRRMQVIARGAGGGEEAEGGDESRAAGVDPGAGGHSGAGAHPGGVTVIDDYGHHPTEVDTTLRALRQHYQPKRLICVFQPHQHSRTRFLMQQFAASFSEADMVIVPDIYFVRDSEEERQAVTAGDLVDRLRQQGVRAMHLHPFEAIIEQLQVLVRPGDLVVTMGAGDVWKVARAFAERQAG